MLMPANLLDLVRHYLLFMDVEGNDGEGGVVTSSSGAVTRAIHRLKTGKTRAQDGEHDRRGGIVPYAGLGQESDDGVP